MINITDIKYGWATLHIGFCSFDCSYLTDIRASLDKLLVFKNADSVNKIIVEGEGQGDLSLVAHLTFEDINDYLKTSEQLSDDDRYDYVINIFWQRLYSRESNSVCLLKFPYKKFVDEWLRVKKEIKESYEKDFMYDLETN